MFIKTIFKKNKGSDTVFTSYRLVESYRSESGPRHRTVLSFGEMTIDKKHFKTLADRIEQILDGKQSMFFVPEDVEICANHYAALLIESKLKISNDDHIDKNDQEVDFDSIDINSIQTSKCRSIGLEYIAYEMINKLKLIDIFKDLDFSESDIKFALILIIGRMINPTSERGTYFWAKHESGLEELLNEDFTRLSRNKMYEIIDKIINNKDEIEQKLRENEKEIFSLKEKIILYDLTNTYFEGSALGNRKAKYGRSKEKRFDCPLVTLGLVIDEQGFPKRSKIMEGNAVEPHTLLSMIKNLIGDDELLDGEKPTVLIDAGIASDDNLKLLRSLGYDYVCVSRGNPLKHIELKDGEFYTVKKDSENEVKVKRYIDNNEQILYCESFLKGKKEQAMKNLYEQRFETGIKSIESSIHKKRGMKQYDKVCERIGRLKEKTAPIARFYEIEIEKDSQEIVTSIKWRRKNENEIETSFNGSYILRSSRTDLNEQEIWELYTTLTRIENTFRVLKTDLNMRPIHHQKTSRSDGHIFITLLAYHVVNSIQTTLKREDIRHTWSTIRMIMRTMFRCTTTMKNKNNETIILRTTSLAEKEQHKILSALKLKIEPIGRKKTIMKL
jgi:hypothetical protein